MTVRLTDEETAALRAQAEAEGRPMQDVVRRAVREYIDRQHHRADVDDALAFVAEHHGRTLEHLADR